MPSPADRNWLSRALSVGRRRPDVDRDLEHCAFCTKDFVNPVDWEPVTPEAWWMLLRCGECHTFREVTVTNAVAERFDLELDRRADMLQRALAKLDRERMLAQAEAMIGALRQGLIDAADFAPRSA
jgi:flavoprotein